MAKKKEVRQNQIYQLLVDNGRLRIQDLADQLHVTTETLRTDLVDLEKQRRVVREHGYVRSLSELEESPLQWREKENETDRKVVGIRAMHLIEDNQVIFLDSGSTVLLGVPVLATKHGITVVTNSIPVAYQTALMDINTIFLGGPVTNIGLRTHGHRVVEAVDEITFDVALLGSDGIANAHGFTILSYNEINIKKHVIAQSKKSIVAMDSSKFKKKASFAFCNFRDIDTLVTNHASESDKEIVKEIPEIIEVS